MDAVKKKRRITVVLLFLEYLLKNNLIKVTDIQYFSVPL